ncbi:MAG: glycoside hydrolase family 88 protein [Odoribacteraceae bacterium]|jgi:rhamnogalacturonyl hydrolase YesR|nr:glycoside hydrolase family 88 protein [Odoribacteraceae bacterium]
MRTITLLATALLLATNARAQAPRDPRATAVQIAGRVLQNTTYQFINRETKETFPSTRGLDPALPIRVQSQYNDWHYTNGVLAIAMIELADNTGDQRYEQFVLRNMNFVFNEGNLEFFREQFRRAKEKGGWRAVPSLSWHMIFRGKRLDDNGPMAASLIELQQRHPDDRFLAYIRETDNHVARAEPRLPDGTIARLWPHEQTVWADDAFMAVSFLARMGKLTGETRYFTDAAAQIINYARYLWSPLTQLYHHCYHADTGQLGVAHWSRANGWVFMATADLLTLMPADHPSRPAVLDIFRAQAAGVARYQAASGLWRQLLDKTDSYEEITGTAMFVFGIARGVKRGWLHPDYIHVAEQGLKGMMTQITPAGDVTNICVGTGIMPSLSFYYARPRQTNTPMGEGPVLRALVEMSDAPPYREIKADDQYDKIKAN